MEQKPERPGEQDLLNSLFKGPKSTDVDNFSIEEPKPLSAEEAESHRLLKIQVLDLLLELKPIERRVLELRFGLEDGRNRTQEEVGREVGRSQSTVCRIEHRALSKLTLQ